MKALRTCSGNLAALTGGPITAPRRAIGAPSAESKVIEGGAGGWSDFDSGAVSASQPTAQKNSTMKPAAPRTAHLR